jgi:cation diffusion facilitator CzcD-associated flavoprotein CzcO
MSGIHRIGISRTTRVSSLYVKKKKIEWVGVEEAGDREILTSPNVFIAVGAIWVGGSPNFDGVCRG